MAVSETMTKVTAKVEFANGHDSNGVQKVMSVNFPTLNPENYDAGKIITVSEGIRQLVGATWLGTYTAKTYELEQE